jgi:uncharacterized membrane protein
VDTEILERRLGRVLAIGSSTSMALFAAGLAVLFAGIDRRWSDRLVHAGLLILFATPFARVLVTNVNFWRERDWTFVLMTSAVLVVLITSALIAML